MGQATQNSENTLFQTAAAGGAIDLRRHRRPGLGGLQHQRGDLGEHRFRPGRAGRRPLDRNVVHRQQVEQHRQRGQRGKQLATSGTRALRPPSRAVPVPMPSRWTRRRGGCSSANSESTLTVFATSTCNQSTTSGCGSPTQIASGGRIELPRRPWWSAAPSSTLYVANGERLRGLVQYRGGHDRHVRSRR